MHVLLVKLSSMGDLIHALPALSDAQAVFPGIKFDWVIDEAFAEVASWHPAVNTIIPTAHRRWRKQKWQIIKNGELKNFLTHLRQTKYDLVIDGQTNFKSALITRLSRGLRCGLDKNSAREFIAHFAYQKKVFVAKQDHAVNRLRILFANILGYALPTTEPNFAIDRNKLIKPLVKLPDRYLIFMHNASWESKIWPENYWSDLAQLAIAAGFSVLLPSGNESEQARAQRIAKIHPQIMALPKMSLSEIAYIIAQAQGAVCNDTGLGHLAAAVQVPSVNLYGPTDSALIGAPGKMQIYLQAQFPCAPCYKKHCFYKGETNVHPACFAQFTPEIVWEKLSKIVL